MLYELKTVRVSGIWDSDVSASLGRVNLLVGPSGVKKFGPIDVLRRVQDWASARFPRNCVPHQGQDVATIDLQCVIGEHSATYRIQEHCEGEPILSHESVYVDGHLVASREYGDARIFYPSGNTIGATPWIGLRSFVNIHGSRLPPDIADVVRGLLSFITSWRIVQIDCPSVRLSLSSPVRHDFVYHLRPDGSNLAQLLYTLYVTLSNTFAEISRYFEAAFGLRLFFLEMEASWRFLADSGVMFTDSALSDNALRFLALATLFLADSAPLVCIEEPERNLHSQAICHLADLMCRQVKEKGWPQKQVIATVHDPEFLDCFRPDGKHLVVLAI